MAAYIEGDIKGGEKLDFRNNNSWPLQSASYVARFTYVSDIQ